MLVSVQSWYDKSGEAVETHRRAAGEEDAEQAENLIRDCFIFYFETD